MAFAIIFYCQAAQLGHLGGQLGHLGGQSGHLGGQSGQLGGDWHVSATELEVEAVREAGRQYHLLADETLVEEMRAAGRGWWATAPMVQRAKFLLITSNPNWVRTLPRQLEGAACGTATRSERAREAQEVEGPPKITFEVTRRWLCPGGTCELECVRTTKLADFINVSELTIGRWLVSHGFISTACTKPNCDGVRRLVTSKGKTDRHTLSGGTALYCTQCHAYSYGDTLHCHSFLDLVNEIYLDQFLPIQFPLFRWCWWRWFFRRVKAWQLCSSNVAYLGHCYWLVIDLSYPPT